MGFANVGKDVGMSWYPQKGEEDAGQPHGGGEGCDEGSGHVDGEAQQSQQVC